MKLVLVCHSLGGGGAERAMAGLANHWARTHQVTVVTLTDAVSDVYTVDNNVQRVRLPGYASLGRFAPRRILGATLRRTILLRRAIRHLHVDAIVSFGDQTNVLSIIASARTGVPVVVSERIYPPAHNPGRMIDSLRRRTYQRASVVHVQTQLAADWASRLVPRERVHVIPGAVALEHPAKVETAVRDEGEPGIRLVSMGRLVPQKGFDLLIRAFAEVATHVPGATLTILGEGPQRAELTDLVRMRGVAGRVRLPGYVPDPWHILGRADIFVLSSRYEGFPNALLEAMALGVPPIAFECPTGPSEIITHNENGILVEPGNVHALADAIVRVGTAPRLRAALASRARDVAHRFEPNLIHAQWDRILEQATST